MRNHDRGACGLLKNFECDLPKELVMARESLEAENHEIRFGGQPGDRRGDLRAAFDANRGLQRNLVVGQRFKLAPLTRDHFIRRFFRQDEKKDNLTAQGVVKAET